MSKEKDQRSLFEEALLPHLGAAYNLARWIMGSDQDAEDMVQEAYLRAYKYFTGYQGGNSRSWLLTIVRNTCYTWLHQNRLQELNLALDEEIYNDESETLNPESQFQHSLNHRLVRQALEKLPVEYRELIVLRELEGMSYKEIALLTKIPIGTVMSRLARGRQRLKDCLVQIMDEEGSHEL
jgi:RNA polymerase sigma-70 factor (ECF subfamily)